MKKTISLIIIILFILSLFMPYIFAADDITTMSAKEFFEWCYYNEENNKGIYTGKDSTYIDTNNTVSSIGSEVNMHYSTFYLCGMLMYINKYQSDESIKSSFQNDTASLEFAIKTIDDMAGLFGRNYGGATSSMYEVRNEELNYIENVGVKLDDTLTNNINIKDELAKLEISSQNERKVGQRFIAYMDKARQRLCRALDRINYQNNNLDVQARYKSLFRYNQKEITDHYERFGKDYYKDIRIRLCFSI